MDPSRVGHLELNNGWWRQYNLRYFITISFSRKEVFSFLMIQQDLDLVIFKFSYIKLSKKLDNLFMGKILYHLPLSTQFGEEVLLKYLSFPYIPCTPVHSSLHYYTLQCTSAYPILAQPKYLPGLPPLLLCLISLAPLHKIVLSWS